MKQFAGILVLIAATFVATQETETTTEGLLRSQADLTLGHEFFETTLFINRGQISAYMNRINSELISSHIDAYAHMKGQILETNEALDAFEVTPQSEECLNSVRNRWGLQVTRFGIRLSTCIDVANRMLSAWNRFLNEIHETGQVTANQVANLGTKTLSETEIFDGRNSLPALINREFRNILGAALPYRDRIEGFLQDISSGIDNTISILEQCDRQLEDDFAAEIADDLARAAICAAV